MIADGRFKILKLLIFVLFLLPFSQQVSSQDLYGNQNPRKERRLGAGLGFGSTLLADPVLAMVKIDYFILPQIDLESNIGFKYSSIGARFHIHPTSSGQRITPFAGTMIGMERGSGVFQIPFGIQFISNKGFYSSANVNELIYLEYKRFEWMFEISVGWRFRL
jgi:hypothetical protein